MEKPKQRRERERDSLGEAGIEEGRRQDKGEESGTGSRQQEDAEHSMVTIRDGNPETSKCWFGRNIIVIKGQLVSPSLG